MNNSYYDQFLCPTDFPWRYANIHATQQHIIAILFSNETLKAKPHPLINFAKQQLQLYFQHELTTFTLPITQEASPFAHAVYEQLLHIPFGALQNYKQIALRLGSANKSRAVGKACGANQISIVIPCHRVINSQGGLSGYAGGIETKKWLIQHELSST